MNRRGDGHRLIRWLWTSHGLGAKLARGSLLPLTGVWRAAVALRNGRLDRRGATALPVPAVSVGNLTVGGSGKTPVASWIADRFQARGITPGVLLRGYGRDEVLVHQHAVPGAVVVADPDRIAGAAAAVSQGARVLVLDDGFQRRDVGRDLNLLLISVEAMGAARWCLPAGPWREPLAAAERADLIVVTRKRADRAAADGVAAELAERFRAPIAMAHLGVTRYNGLVSGRPVDRDSLRNRRVVAATAIADPEAFIAQTKLTGAQVQAATWRDHYDFQDEDVAWLAQAARKADFVVLTEKDAVKLRDRWPASVPEPLVAVLEISWERGEAELTTRLDALVRPSVPL